MTRPSLKSILVTGGAGFIGSNFIRYLFEHTEFDGQIINIDCLTYAANLDNLRDIQEKFGTRYHFEEASINDLERVRNLAQTYSIDTFVHFAAESHVDRSILGPQAFIQTNILGTFQLLEAAREIYSKNKNFVFYHVSTDEVYGSLGAVGKFKESTAYDPRSPYSASKAASDHLVRACYHTYGLPILISNCSNNYGPYQHLEKLIPHMITQMLIGERLPIYGDGKNIRDWLFVEDHCEAIWLILNKGRIGETYNIGGDCELENIRLVELLCKIVAEETKVPEEQYLKLIQFVKDRPGHDRRYAIDFTKLHKELGWKPSHNIEEGLRKTVRWYLDQSNWQSTLNTDEYKNWIKQNYLKARG